MGEAFLVLRAVELHACRIDPEGFEVVVTPRVLVEDVHHHVAEVEQHPVPLRQPLDARTGCAALALQVLLDPLGDRIHLTIASTTHHDDVVGVVDLPAYIHDLDVQSLFFEGCFGDPESQLSTRIGVSARRW